MVVYNTAFAKLHNKAGEHFEYPFELKRTRKLTLRGAQHILSREWNKGAWPLLSKPIVYRISCYTIG